MRELILTKQPHSEVCHPWAACMPHALASSLTASNSAFYEDTGALSLTKCLLNRCLQQVLRLINPH